MWAWNAGTSDTADFYVSDSVPNPNWVHVGSVQAPGGGAQVLTSPHFELTSTLMAARVNFRYNGSRSPCSGGNYDDVDDLVFAVLSDAPAMPTTAGPTTGPTAGPTRQPSDAPTIGPTASPSGEPTDLPTTRPTKQPSDTPTTSPPKQPSDAPTTNPTKQPSGAPTTSRPTASPTKQPTDAPNFRPT